MPDTPEATLLLRHMGWIEALATRLVADPELAKDAVQETWVAALEHTPDTRGPVRGWIATVLRNRIGKERVRNANRRQREHAVSRTESTHSTYDVVAKASMQKELVETVLALDEPYRRTVLLRFFEDLSYREIADRMNVTPATVNSRLTRGLVRLRERLDREYGERRAWVVLFAPLTRVPEGLYGPRPQ